MKLTGDYQEVIDLIDHSIVPHRSYIPPRRQPVAFHTPLRPPVSPFCPPVFPRYSMPSCNPQEIAFSLQNAQRQVTEHLQKLNTSKQQSYHQGEMQKLQPPRKAPCPQMKGCYYGTGCSSGNAALCDSTCPCYKRGFEDSLRSLHPDNEVDKLYSSYTKPSYSRPSGEYTPPMERPMAPEPERRPVPMQPRVQSQPRRMQGQSMSKHPNLAGSPIKVQAAKKGNDHFIRITFTSRPFGLGLKEVTKRDGTVCVVTSKQKIENAKLESVPQGCQLMSLNKQNLASSSKAQVVQVSRMATLPATLVVKVPPNKLSTEMMMVLSSQNTDIL